MLGMCYCVSSVISSLDPDIYTQPHTCLNQCPIAPPHTHHPPSNRQPFPHPPWSVLCVVVWIIPPGLPTPQPAIRRWSVPCKLLVCLACMPATPVRLDQGCRSAGQGGGGGRLAQGCRSAGQGWGGGWIKVVHLQVRTRGRGPSPVTPPLL